MALGHRLAELQFTLTCLVVVEFCSNSSDSQTPFLLRLRGLVCEMETFGLRELPRARAQGVKQSVYPSVAVVVGTKIARS